MDEGKPEQSKQKEWLKPLGFLFTIGWYVALSVIIPAGIGYWLDLPGQFNSRPLCTIIGFVIGTIIAFFGLFRMLRQFYIRQKESWKNTKKESKE